MLPMLSNSTTWFPRPSSMTPGDWSASLPSMMQWLSSRTKPMKTSGGWRGVGGEESLCDGVAATMRQRFPWLVVNLLTSILASLVIAMFTSTIEAVVALAVLMPIVASMGGNACTQTLTISVRALATKDLTEANAWRVIWREINAGLLNGLTFAAIAGLVGLIWFGSPILGTVLGLAMVGNLFVAGLAGNFIPLGLDRFGLDPALASGVFVTTVTDVVGFFCFLALAALILL